MEKRDDSPKKMAWDGGCGSRYIEQLSAGNIEVVGEPYAGSLYISLRNLTRGRNLTWRKRILCMYSLDVQAG